MRQIHFNEIGVQKAWEKLVSNGFPLKTNLGIVDVCTQKRVEKTSKRTRGKEYRK
jgi:hypothetical protein